jgi:hypothetical protein
MKWIKGFIGAALIVAALGITGCYTVIMVPQTVESYDNGQWAQEESSADTTEVKQDNGQTVNNFYIYDDWPGHSYFDPFWDSPYHWRYSSWWGGAFYDPWYDPWPYYGYYGNYGWSPYNHYGYVDWYTPGYHDPYWVYMDGHHGRDRTGDKRQPFDRHDSIHSRAGLDGSGFSATDATFSNGISRVGKSSRTATDMGMGTHRIRRTTSESTTKSSGAGISTSSSDHRIRRSESAESSGSAMKTARGSSGNTKSPTKGSSGSDHRVRRESSTSSSGAGSTPSHSGSSGSSGSRVGSSSSGSSGSSGRSSSPSSSSSGSSGSGSHRTRR